MEMEMEMGMGMDMGMVMTMDMVMGMEIIYSILVRRLWCRCLCGLKWKSTRRKW